MARLIKVNGEEVEVFPKQGETFTSEELEGFVGGTMGMVGFFHEDQHFWTLYNYENEIAMMERRQPALPYNAQATALTPQGLGIEYFGDVLVAPESEWNDNLYHQYLAKLELEEVYDQEPGSSNQKHYRRLWPPIVDDDDDF